MIYIEFDGKTPVNTPLDSAFPSWAPWAEAKWNEWLEKSEEYLETLTTLHSEGKINERNKFIDDHSDHWGKLKLWLQVLSHGKCWFSEVQDKYSHYDVEHFRPKKQAKGPEKENIRDGYWWLAFDYMNYRLCGNVGNRMKGIWFPLKEGTPCSTFECQCEESEAYYILDPTDPYDPELLAFNEEGNAIPSPLCQSEWERLRAEKTIEYLKLSDHEALTEARKKLWQEMNIEIDLYLKAKAKLSSGNTGIREKVKGHLKKIKDYTLPTSELSSVARWCLYLRNDQSLLKLVA